MYFTRLQLSHALLIALVAVGVCLISPDLLAKGTVSKELEGIAKIFDSLNELFLNSIVKAGITAAVIVAAIIAGFVRGYAAFASTVSIGICLVFVLNWIDGAFTLVLS